MSFAKPGRNLEERGLKRKVLGSFFPEFEARTIREIMERTGYSYERAYTALIKLSDEKAVIGSRVGKTRILTPNRSKALMWYNSFVEYQLGRLMSFSQKYKNASESIFEFSRIAQPRMIVVFGSYARGEAKEDSDLDMICVSRKNGPGIRRHAASFWHSHRINLAPVPLSINEFMKLEKGNKELFEDIRNTGVVLNDYGLFYDAVYANK